MYEPKIRANWSKFTIRSAKQAPVAMRDRILGAIPEELRLEIRLAGRLEWLPARVFVDLCEIIRTAVGSDGTQTFFRTSLRDAIDEPFMKPLARGAIFLFGNSPAALLRRTPQAWQLAVRDCGEIKIVETGEPTSLLVRIEGLPPVCRKPSMLDMYRGGFLGQMDWMQALGATLAGSVEPRADEFLENGRLDFTVRWSRV